MMKFILFCKVFILFAVISNAQPHELIAPIYPDAIPNTSDHSEAVYLSNSSYEAIKSFYLKQDNVLSEEEKDEGDIGKKCSVKFSLEKKSYTEDFKTGVSIYHKTGNAKHVIMVLDKFRTAVATDNYSGVEYENLKEKYEHLKYYHFPVVNDPQKNRKISKSEEIYKKYENIDKQTAKGAEMTGEEVQQKYMQLVSQGKHQEAADLMKNFSESAMQTASDMLDMDKWEECLKEMEKYAYKNKIIIANK